jgi:GT2 family glycosyltransferase
LQWVQWSLPGDQSKPCAMPLALGASYENPVPGSGGRGSGPVRIFLSPTLVRWTGLPPLAIEILCPPGNLGFAKGFDLGIAAALEAGTEYIFLLNNDAVVSRHCIEILVSVVRSTPGREFSYPRSPLRR